MLQRIEASEVMRRTTRLFDDYNNSRPLVTHTRMTARGEIQVSRREGLIPEAVTTTFHVILRNYIQNYNLMAEILPLELQDPASPPGLRTNAVYIGKDARCTDRTVRNHLAVLRELDCIETKFHGSKRNFEVWIKPRFLYGDGAGPEPQNALETAPEGKERKIFPHTSTHREIIGTEKGNADMFIKHGEDCQGQGGKTDSWGEPPLAGRAQHREVNVAPGGAGGEMAAIVPSGHVFQNWDRNLEEARTLLPKKPAMPTGIDKKFFLMLMDFWLYAWKVIYPNRDFSREQQEKAIAAIAAGVYNNFDGDRTEQQWFEFQQIQMAKLDKAGRFYDNHPDAYRPDPYAVHIPGKGYFDAINLKGFVGIDAWIKKDSIRNARNRQAYADQAEARTKRGEALLRTARRDFEKQRKNEKPRNEVAGKDQLALFQYYNVIFAGLGKKWQEAFCKQYLDQQARSFAPPAYLQRRRKRAYAGEVSQATIVQVEEWMQDGDWYCSE